MTKDRSIISYNLQLHPVTHGPKHHFFGYYDKCPWDSTGRFMLTLEVDFMNRLPEPEDVAVIGIIDFHDNNTFVPVAETRSWNWQQGAMLQWVSSDRLIIYNDCEKNHFVSILLDIKTGKRRILPLPVYTLSHDGRFALSINFSRLHHTRRGYGYAGGIDPWQDNLYPDDDGIYLMDVNTGKYKLILSYAQVAAFDYSPAMEEGKHWFEHLAFNPRDSRFCFLHRFQLNEGGIYTRLLTADLDGSNLYVVNEGMVSHLDWLNSNKILAWARKGKIFPSTQRRGFSNLTPLKQILAFIRGLGIPNWARKHIIGDHYLLLTDQTTQVDVIGEDILTSDGHCSCSPDRRWILTDTYPDENNEQHLILYHPETMTKAEIGTFYSPPELDKTPMRCDLHPRWNRDGTQICIDSTHEGSRQMYVLDVSRIIKNFESNI